MTDIADDAPIRLSEAARICFPDGTMTGGGLRRLAQKGKLTIERINGRDYTTIKAVQEMRELCRVVPKVLVCGSGPVAATATVSIMLPCSSSLIKDAKSRLDARLTRPTKPNKSSQ